jgi:hypothetical protein
MGEANIIHSRERKTLLMVTEKVVLAILWYAGVIAVMVGIPKRRYREAAAFYLICQPLTWAFSFIELRLGLLTFPVREFPVATDINFTIEFWVHPLIFVFYSLHKDRFPGWKKYAYLAAIITLLTIVDKLIESYTGLIDYVRHTPLSIFLCFYVLFLLADFYSRWFFQDAGLKGRVRSSHDQA